MRFPVAGAAPARKIVSLRGVPGRGVVVRVLTSAVRLWVDPDETVMRGAPGSAGTPLTSDDPALILNPFAGELFAVASADAEVEVSVFPSQAQPADPPSRTIVPRPAPSAPTLADGLRSAFRLLFRPRTKPDAYEKLIDRIRFFPAVLLVVLLSAGVAFGQDIRVECGRGDAPQFCTLTRGQAWTNGNQVWIFRPIRPNVSVYIFVHNLNTTSAHASQAISVFQSPSVTVADLSNNADLWTQDSVTQNNTAGALCNSVNARAPLVIGSASGLGTCFITTSFAAQIAVRITGASSAAGSPDSFDLFVVQETGEPKGQQAGSGSSTVRVQDGVGATLATVTGANALKVDGSAVTQPVSGTLTANAGAGNFNVVGAVTANQGGAPWTQRIQDGVGVTLASVTAANALKTDGSAVNQPITSPSVPGGRPANTLPVSPAGATFSDLGRNLSGAGTTTVELTTAANELVNFNTCNMQFNSPGGTGTAPTLQIRVQFSANGTDWNDRVVPALVGVGPVIQEASLSSGFLGITTYSVAVASPAVVDGTFPGRMRLSYTLTGTTPAYTGVNTRVICK